METQALENSLTDQEFWSKYWESKTDILHEINSNYVFSALFRKVCAENKITTSIELGGFPGYFSLFLTKYLKRKCTLLDFFILPKIIHELEEFNNVPTGSIRFIEGDLFEATEREKFDLVFSCGLIEHFQDTKDIIRRHIDFLDKDGTLLLTLPNFRGVNGWWQRKFDKENYDKHNINSMDPELLRSIFKELGVEVSEYGYLGKFSIWLENKKEQPILIKGLFKLCWLVGKVITRVIPVESKLMSPYIFIWGKKK
ncbi:class I SAM-dependent methyltransferase [Solitalea sp. MAHUQ-68]|uniref:Class I SAM-dependent methyltransferase n=1 Tax=Solitalea agri TaxID=2953739 RepID=A0A9X2F2E8_9SPHI|nr:class I SAM-dependent methyltransferase [Solitalea agri]MCO4292935.1 class I SAM-dependent methyltransferase [Solitalea agri]